MVRKKSITFESLFLSRGEEDEMPGEIVTSSSIGLHVVAHNLGEAKGEISRMDASHQNQYLYPLPSHRWKYEETATPIEDDVENNNVDRGRLMKFNYDLVDIDSYIMV